MINSVTEASPKFVRKIAIISGKGGSGKTMIAAAAAQLCSLVSKPTLVDADTGTAGLSYYLGLKYVHNITVGLADVINNPSQFNELPLQPIFWEGGPAQFLPIGDPNEFYDNKEDTTLILGEVIGRLSQLSPCIIADCRGGIDDESTEVCRNVDDIILIVEPDTTSFQATKHVVDRLSLNGLATKLRGFIINKVFEDPTFVARNGSSLFRCRCLGAVPFDLEATRDFLVGNIPKINSQFGIQVWQALDKAYPDIFPKPGRAWTFEEFGQVSLVNPEGARGGLLAVALLLASASVYGTAVFLEPSRLGNITFNTSFIYISFVCGLVGSLERTRRLLGRVMGVYVRFIARIAGIRS